MLSVSAASTQHRLNSELYELSDLQVDWFGEAGDFEARLNAPKASYTNDASRMTLGPRVQVSYTAERSSQGVNQMQLETGELVAMLDEETLSTSEPLRVTLPAGELNVQSMQANLATGEYRFGPLNGVMRRVQ